ncbi:UNVERIFIED_CONTAM: hypothetical protein GTU68_058079 [Idotea baltica]|nr:hypothetical protein [Idotea baltica]
MFVFSPSPETFKRLLEHADSVGSFDGGDQGLLNTFFPNWNRLSFIYNMVASVTYTYSPAFKQYGKDVKFVHFLGATKPWQQAYHTSSGSVVPRPGQEHISSHLNAWWRIFTKSVQTELPESLTEQLIGLHVSPEQSMEECRQRWEHGNPDFRGEDSFDNILAHIDSKINK